jgi:PBP1b-binding outer membrane lipoprotein LpoB
MFRLIFIVSALFLTGCSSFVEVDQMSNVYTASKGCKVKIYQTEKQAEKEGVINELCVVSGTSSGSFSHTVDTAIEKRVNDICRCGANKAYIQSRSVGGWGTARVTLVAFEFDE